MTHDAIRLLNVLGDTDVTIQTLYRGRAHRALYDTNLEAALGRLSVYSEVGSDIYMSVNKTSKNGRDAEHIQKLRAVFVDLDKGIPESWPLPPSAVVESSPGKQQVYWALNEHIEVNSDTLKQWQSIEDRFVHGLGADWNARDSARILRVPGFANYKYMPAVPVKLLDANSNRYGLGELDTAVRDIVVPKPLATTSWWAPSGLPPDSVRERRFRFYLNKTPFPAVGSGKRNGFFFRKSCVGVVDFALEPQLTATILAEYSALRHGREAYDYNELLTLAERASTYGKGVRGSVFARAETEMNVETEL